MNLQIVKSQAGRRKKDLPESDIQVTVHRDKFL